jgi:hypothetical protein
MEMNKAFTMSMLAAAVALTGCGSDSDSNGGSASTDVSAMIDNRSAFALNGDDACHGIGTELGEVTLDLDTAIAGTGTEFVPLCGLQGRIAEDTTLAADVVWNLQGSVFVGFGDQEVASEDDVQLLKDNAVTLTIEAGTQIRSSLGASLVITRGSKIMANGTAAAPIVMSSREEIIDDGVDTAENVDGNGEWGGLVVQGFAQNNKCDQEASICNLQSEGNVGKFGGYDNDDNSGSISYLVLAEGGFEIAPDNEINGLTLMSVGYNTTIDYVQIHNNADDGVEFFGGTVNVKHLVLTNNNDDSIDWDEGFQGNIQYAIVTGDNIGDNGIEADNAGPSNDAQPIAKPSLMNVTFLAENDADYAIKVRRGTGALIGNSAVVGAGWASGALEVDGAGTGTQTGGELVFTNALFDTNVANLITASEAGVDAGTFSITQDVALTVDSAFALEQAEASLDAASSIASANAVTEFFTATDFVGAVAPGTAAAEAWWAGWTLDGTVAAD